ncbi:unnamed protein product [Rhodiola kirilowii]
MTDEINALLKNQTWILLPPPPGQRIVGCKWIFKIKRHSDGSVELLQSTLGRQGFSSTIWPRLC